jgi:hypothetical protein
MSWIMRRITAMVILTIGGLLVSGCATQSQYKSPSVQEESQTYRSLYQPFGLEAGPSATTSGDE